MNGMPKPTESHKKLEKLAGTWSGDEKMNPSPFGPGGTARGRYNCRVDIDGFFVLQDYVQEQDGRVSYRGHGIFGYDSERKEFTWYWVDSMGMVPPSPSRGQWSGDTLQFEHEPMGERRGRYTFKFPDDRTFTFTIENSQDGGKTWQLFMDSRYRKD
jgi:hypothetical protein